MTLSEKQRKFSLMVSRLIGFAYALGYEVTLGDAHAWRGDKRHSRNSLHYKRLAIDLNLFMDGKWLRKSEHHTELGEFWEAMGGSWGGRFGDGNHYSIEHLGKK